MNSLSSRYSLKNINNNYYNTVNISGNTYPLATVNNNGEYSQGYIFAPYIMAQSIEIISEFEFKRKILREKRIKKLNKLKELYE